MVKKNIQNLLPESMIHSDSTTNNAVLQPSPRKKSLLDFSGLQPSAIGRLRVSEKDGEKPPVDQALDEKQGDSQWT